ncbi:polyprenyl synthetase family protein (plasmid) [Streptomyces olivoreticuli]|uniref:polyprenyl synthetase family protein n=1 Tax=Streptomyces olivoreticuli TaxID=68246 RepID=UPI00265A2263|nr:polyprenyl synthetase family protein [Streptomyces olivoreticuli]WKK27815.1 polyprenyl synthetase family protein [Streptomyces olivoreticuli]
MRSSSPMITHPRINQAQAAIKLALQEAVQRLDPAASGIVAYHFGWRDKNGILTDAGSGRHRAGLLALLCAAANGADWRPALPAAVACELASNAATMQDDIIDEDTTRRGRRATWSAFGTNRTLLTCTTMNSLAIEILTEQPHPAAAPAARKLSQTLVKLNVAQLQDIEFERRNNVSLDEYLHMVDGKACATFSCPCALGAMFTDVPGIDDLAAFGSQLGLVWQLRNDLLGIWGDPDQTGKPRLSDLKKRKKTFPVITALESTGSDRDELEHLLAPDGRPLGADETVRAAALVERCGGLLCTEREIRSRLEAAIRPLDCFMSDDTTRADIISLARFFAKSTR